MFTGSDGGRTGRSNFRRRVWLPALTGDDGTGRPPVEPGMHFHDLRHTHKTWMIEDRVPEVVQHQRLGHRFGGVMGTYSHVTRPMIDDLLAALQDRWDKVGARSGLTTSVLQVWSRSCAPNLLPKQVSGPSTEIVNEPLTRQNRCGRYWDRTSDLFGVNEDRKGRRPAET